MAKMKWFRSWGAVLVIGGGLCIGGASLAANQQKKLSPRTSAKSATPLASITFCDDPDPTCAGATFFSVNSLRDLIVFVRWTNVVPGNHVQTMHIRLPGGNLYWARETSFKITGKSPGSYTLMNALPVAGTWISQRKITGTWTVEVSLDGSAVGSKAVQLSP